MMYEKKNGHNVNIAHFCKFCFNVFPYNLNGLELQAVDAQIKEEKKRKTH